MHLEQLNLALKFSILRVMHCFRVSIVLNLRGRVVDRELQAELTRRYPNFFRKSGKRIVAAEIISDFDTVFSK